MLKDSSALRMVALSICAVQAMVLGRVVRLQPPIKRIVRENILTALGLSARRLTRSSKRAG